MGAFLLFVILIHTKVRGWQVKMKLTDAIEGIFEGGFARISACTLATLRPGTKKCLFMCFLPVF